jgi:hypothetical protein
MIEIVRAFTQGHIKPCLQNESSSACAIEPMAVVTACQNFLKVGLPCVDSRVQHVWTPKSNMVHWACTTHLAQTIHVLGFFKCLIL